MFSNIGLYAADGNLERIIYRPLITTTVCLDDEMLKAMRAAFNETMDELMATDPEVKMLMDDLTAFMEDYKAWENIGSIGRNSLWD